MRYIVVGLFLIGLFGWIGRMNDSRGIYRDSGPDINGTPYTENAFAINRDAEGIYSIQCAMCHQPNGQGGQGETGIAPPLSGSDWVLGNKERVIRILLHGLSGEIEVKGQTYDGVMPSFGAILSSDEIAQVLTYIRQSFGNDATEVTAREVKAVREAHTDRGKPWTVDELEEIPQSGADSDTTDHESG